MFPKKSKFTLKSTGHTYYLRQLCVQDNLWIIQRFGDRLQDIFNPASMDIDAISQIIYRVLVDKSDFKKVEITELDEDGNEKKIEIGGYRLFQRLMSTDDIENVIWAFNETMGISRPMPPKEDVKKKVTKKVTKKSAKKVKRKAK